MQGMKGLKPALTGVQPSPCHNCHLLLDFEHVLVAPSLSLVELPEALPAWSSLLGPPCLVSIVSFAWLPLRPCPALAGHLRQGFWYSILYYVLAVCSCSAGLELPLCCFATRVRRKRACRACSRGSLAFRDPLLLWALSLDTSIHVGNFALPDGYLLPCRSCSLPRLFARCSLLMFFLICLLHLPIRFTHLVQGHPASLILYPTKRALCWSRRGCEWEVGSSGPEDPPSLGSAVGTLTRACDARTPQASARQSRRNSGEGKSAQAFTGQHVWICLTAALELPRFAGERFQQLTRVRNTASADKRAGNLEKLLDTFFENPVLEQGGHVACMGAGH